MPRSRPASTDTRCIVTVCRGCCCGTVEKHPDVDHAGQLAALTAGIGSAGRVRVTDCLDVCERSNVVVVNPSGPGRRRGARPTWLAGVLHAGTIAEIVEWVHSGGPGVGDPPGLLAALSFRAPRRSRSATDGR